MHYPVIASSLLETRISGDKKPLLRCSSPLNPVLTKIFFMVISAGLQDIPLTVPKPMVQELVKRFVEKKEWKKLYFLFIGGGGIELKYQYGDGGLATGCDASCVPLEQVVDSTISNVDVAKFVEVLIRNGAPPKGSPGCRESPLTIATRKRNQELIDVLSNYDQVIHWHQNF